MGLLNFVGALNSEKTQRPTHRLACLLAGGLMDIIARRGRNSHSQATVHASKSYRPLGTQKHMHTTATPFELQCMYSKHINDITTIIISHRPSGGAPGRTVPDSLHFHSSLTQTTHPPPPRLQSTPIHSRPSQHQKQSFNDAQKSKKQWEKWGSNPRFLSESRGFKSQDSEEQVLLDDRLKSAALNHCGCV